MLNNALSGKRRYTKHLFDPHISYVSFELGCPKKNPNIIELLKIFDLRNTNNIAISIISKK